MSGWIKLHRKLREHWLWTENREFNRAEAWLDLLLAANHSERKLSRTSAPEAVERGAILTSDGALGKRWNWSRTRVSRFLACLENDGMVRLERYNRGTKIHIANYETYQAFGEDDAQPVRRKSRTKQTSDEHQTGTLKELKNEKELKKKEVLAIASNARAREEIHLFGKRVRLTADERARLDADHGAACAAYYLEAFDDWLDQSPTGTKQREHLKPAANNYRAILGFIRRDRENARGFFAPTPSAHVNGQYGPVRLSPAERRCMEAEEKIRLLEAQERIEAAAKRRLEQ